MSDETKIKQEAKYGLCSDGTYLTPYNFTVIYDSKSDFETAVAFLCEEAQVAPADGTFDEIMVLCEHPTPYLILFGTKFSLDLKKFLQKGFCNIKIFLYEDQSTNMKLESDDNGKITTFRLDDLYKNFKPVRGAISIYILELIKQTTFQNTTSMMNNPEITPQNGKYFLDSIKFTGQELGEMLLKICSTVRGFDMINELILRGKSIDDFCTTLANIRINNGLTYKIGEHCVCAILSTDLTEKIIMQIPKNEKLKNIDYVILYNMVINKVSTTLVPGFDLTFISDKINILDIYDSERLKNSSSVFHYDDTKSTSNFGKIWVPITQVKNFLPFMAHC